jgi:hypothetical protein
MSSFITVNTTVFDELKFKSALVGVTFLMSFIIILSGLRMMFMKKLEFTNRTWPTMNNYLPLFN